MLQHLLQSTKQTLSALEKVGSYDENRQKFLHKIAHQGHYGHCVRIAK